MSSKTVKDAKAERLSQRAHLLETSATKEEHAPDLTGLDGHTPNARCRRGLATCDENREIRNLTRVIHNGLGF